MSTGLTIQKATYGTGSASVDVTGAVSTKVKDGVLNFTVSPTSLGVEDPAPGQLKTLDISYTINNGSKNDISKKDNDLVFIDAPPARDASGLQIVKAEYGYSGNWTDVTDALQNLMRSDGSIDVTVGFKEVGLPDPNPNKQKQLKVDYTLNGSKSTDTLKDGQRFKISAPPLEDTSDHRSPTQHAFSLAGTLLQGVFLFVGVLFHTLSAIATAEFGSYVFGPGFWWVSFAVGLIPLFGFVTLPILVFMVRLFRSSDIFVQTLTQ